MSIPKWHLKRHVLIVLLLVVSLITLILFASFIQDSGSARVSSQVVHYPPTSSNLNDLTFVLNGSGTPGIFDSSITPEKEYGIYNWCNMPHVRTQEYKCVMASSNITGKQLLKNFAGFLY